jgi:polyhydroxyalkanoate synthase subunit PhaC
MTENQGTPNQSANNEAPTVALPDPAEWSRVMGGIAERSHHIIADFIERHKNDPLTMDSGTPTSIATAFLEMTTRLMTDPSRILQAQVELWGEYVNLWQSAARRWMGEDAQPIVTPNRDDKRFKDSAWNENVLFDYIKQSYLLTARWMQNQVKQVEGLDPKAAQKVDFYTRQFVDAMAPSNFLLTNPEVLRKTLETGGENLLNGLQNLVQDLEKGQGELRISMTDTEAFEVGRNIALSPGAVVFRNDLIELIQYSPTTETVQKTPLLIVPPWINKFYILDLKPQNSFIKWAVDQGLTVFCISWVNPEPRLTSKSFADYMKEGPLDAMAVVQAITGEPKVNLIGYCLGGTLTASTLAYLAAKRRAPVKSVTYFTTMVDFTEAGELSVFIDEEQLQSLEHKMAKTGVLEGRDMANSFNMLRANDLIWSFVVNNYLLGKDPFPFDLLYWNGDSTRMPAAMHSFYLRKMYQENLLIEPGGIELEGVKIDLRKVKTPTLIVSTREDHIAPWKSTYAGTQLYSGPVQFLLAGSGHIAGIVNPPAANKYAHWVRPDCPATPDAWLEGAEQQSGSWWPTWREWLRGHSGAEIPARALGSEKFQVLEEAPGSYVKVRS